MSRQTRALREAAFTVRDFVLTREVAAAVALVGGVAAALSGALILWGIGWALLVAAVILIGLSLLLGWE